MAAYWGYQYSNGKRRLIVLVSCGGSSDKTSFEKVNYVRPHYH